MKTGVRIDDRELRRMLPRYLATTSKNAAAALNGKHRDLWWRAIRHMPKASPAIVRAAAYSPALVTWACNETFGRGGWGRDEWEAMQKVLRRRVRSVGYMRHTLAKPGSDFPPIVSKAGKERLPPGAAGARRRRNIRASVKLANRVMLRSAVKLQAGTKGTAKDAATKRSMIETSLRKSLAWVIDDMKAYLVKKQREAARKGGR